MKLLKKRKGAVALEYIITFPAFIFVLACSVIILLMVMNIMKYNDLATEIANNSNFYTEESVPVSTSCTSAGGGTNEISNQCSYFVDNNYSETYVFSSPYVSDVEIETTQLKDGSATTETSDGVLMYIDIYYKMFGFDFKSSGVSVIF